MARNKKIEECVIAFYKALPKELRRFAFSVKRAGAMLDNCSILSYQEISKRRNVSLDTVITWCGSKTGCTCKEKGSDNYIIMYNDAPDILEARKRFTIAHELGHILLEHLVVLERYGIYYSSHANRSFEREANRFAACLLCPMPILDEIKLTSSWMIGKMFGLSKDATNFALDNYKRYDRYDDISWHYDIIELFGFSTYSNDNDCEFGIDSIDMLSPIISIPPTEDIWAKKPTSKPLETEEPRFPRLFEDLEHDWLYPQSLGLS